MGSNSRKLKSNLETGSARILAVIAVLLLALVLEHIFIPVSVKLVDDSATPGVGGAPPYFKRMRLLNNTKGSESVKIESVEVRRQTFDEGTGSWANEWEEVTDKLEPDVTAIQIGPRQVYAPSSNIEADYLNGARVRVMIDGSMSRMAEVKLDHSSQSAEIHCIVENVQVDDTMELHLRMWLVYGTSSGVGAHKYDDSTD